MDQHYVLLKNFSEQMIVSALSSIDCFFEPINLVFPESGPPLGYEDMPFMIDFKTGWLSAQCNVFFHPCGQASGTIVITDKFEGRFLFFSFVGGKPCPTIEQHGAGNC